MSQPKIIAYLKPSCGWSMGVRAVMKKYDLAYEDPNLPGRTLWLRSARPRHCTPDTPLLFVHHGVLRNGGDGVSYRLLPKYGCR